MQHDDEPEDLHLHQDGADLAVCWPGERCTIPAARLRAMARDAASVRQRLDFGEICVAPDLRITAMQRIGAMGVNLHFSDGHDRAIYPWRYLREIAQADVN